MASYKALAGVLTAIKDYLERRMADDLALVVDNPGVEVLGSTELSGEPSGNHIGLYLHRISVDPFGRNRYLKKPGGTTPQPELCVNLHMMLLAWTNKGDNEARLMGWAMQQLGNGLELDISHLKENDSDWTERESLQVIPEDMDTEDLLRIWDGLPKDYRLSAPYLVKTLRLLPVPEIEDGQRVQTVANAMGTQA